MRLSAWIPGRTSLMLHLNSCAFSKKCQQPNPIILIHTLLALFSVIGFIGKFNGVTGQSDLTFTCPQTWYSGQTLTLYCEVVKASVFSKCGAAANTTYFSLDQNLGTYGGMCIIYPVDYSSCNHVIGSEALRDCGCQENTTHYIFVYQFVANGSLHNGNWDCSKTCTTSPGVQNPLTTYIDPNCKRVQVRDRPAVTGGAGKLSRLVLVLTCCIGCLTSLGIWPGVCPCY